MIELAAVQGLVAVVVLVESAWLHWVELARRFVDESNVVVGREVPLEIDESPS